MKAPRNLLGVAYPFCVYAGLQHLTAREVALAIAGLFLLRGLVSDERPDPAKLRPLFVPGALVGAVLLATLVFDAAVLLLLVPGLVNLALLVAFGRTLVGAGPPLVESLARLQHDDVGAGEAAYCRDVTRVWCAFFALNASVCLWLAIFASTDVWALYTGLVAYVLVGLLFGAEMLVRAKRFGRYEGTLFEPLLRRLFARNGAA